MRLETPVTNDDVNGNNEIMEYILAYTLDDDDPISYHSAIISCIKNNYMYNLSNTILHSVCKHSSTSIGLH